MLDFYYPKSEKYNIDLGGSQTVGRFYQEKFPELYWTSDFSETSPLFIRGPLFLNGSKFTVEDTLEVLERIAQKRKVYFAIQGPTSYEVFRKCKAPVSFLTVNPYIAEKHSIPWVPMFLEPLPLERKTHHIGVYINSLKEHLMEKKLKLLQELSLQSELYVMTTPRFVIKFLKIFPKAKYTQNRIEFFENVSTLVLVSIKEFFEHWSVTLQEAILQECSTVVKKDPEKEELDSLDFLQHVTHEQINFNNYKDFYQDLFLRMEEGKELESIQLR